MTIRTLGQASVAGGPAAAMDRLTLGQAPVTHFDLSPPVWGDQHIQVVIRIRPPNCKEKTTSMHARCLKQETAQSLTWLGPSKKSVRFTFDHIACETIDQETLFRVVGRAMIENCLSGYNSCILAYGLTGSGKTHTMFGNIGGLNFSPNPNPNRGMAPRLFEYLISRIEEEKEGRKDEKIEYKLKCSFLELYKEQFTDLLDPSSTNLHLRGDSKKGVYVENLSEFEVQTVGDIFKLLLQGSSNRKVAATNMNKESSRSHSVFTCVIESRWEKDSTSNLQFARLNLVDLAGLERPKASGVEGERLKEAANINKSLSTLGHVIMTLSDVAHGKSKHVPYRNSKLTLLLQDSLGGNSKTMIIANVSPSICYATETLETLRFAQQAKYIKNTVVANKDSFGDVISLQQEVTSLQHQNQLLKEELSALKRQNVSKSLSSGSSIVHYTAQAEDQQNIPPTVIPTNSRRKRLKWTHEEEEILKEGVRKFSNQSKKNIPWKKILDFGRAIFAETRTSVDLKDKWKNNLAKRSSPLKIRA